MGNRAVITASTAHSVAQSSDVGVYLHWNGGRDSVEAFLAYCDIKGYRSPDKDCYGYARLCQVIGNFFGGELSIGVDKCKNLDCKNWDNGVYIVKDWRIVGRRYFHGEEQCQHELFDMLCDINNSQPFGERVGVDVLKAYADKIQEERKNGKGE